VVQTRITADELIDLHRCDDDRGPASPGTEATSVGTIAAFPT
jgi:hypothetical protein